MKSGTFPVACKYISNEYGTITNYLIEDPAYSLPPTYMKEFDSCKWNNQVIFNTMLRSAKNLVKCVFVSSKARWRILTKKMI